MTTNERWGESPGPPGATDETPPGPGADGYADLDARLDALWQRARRAQRRAGLTGAVVLAAWFAFQAFVLDPADEPDDMSNLAAGAFVAGVFVVFAVGTLLAYRFARRGSWFGASLVLGLPPAEAKAVDRAVRAGTPPDDPLLAAVARDRARSQSRWAVVSMCVLALLLALHAWILTLFDDAVRRGIFVTSAVCLVGALAWLWRSRRRFVRYLDTRA